MKLLSSVKNFFKEESKEKEFNQIEWEAQQQRSKRDYFSKEAELERKAIMLQALSPFIMR